MAADNLSILTKALHELEVPEQKPEADWSLLKAAIEKQVAFMLANQGERLMQVLYRLDVREVKVQQIFAHHPPETWPEKITQLILEREEERLKWRAFYSEQK